MFKRVSIVPSPIYFSEACGPGVSVLGVSSIFGEFATFELIARISMDRKEGTLERSDIFETEIKSRT